MFRLLTTAALLIFSLHAYQLTPVKVAQGVYCFIGDFHGPTKENQGFVSNVCLTQAGGQILLMDTGPTYGFAKIVDAQAKKLFGKPVSVVAVTNYHDDRMLGASYFEDKGVPVYVGKGTKQAIKEHQNRFMRIVNVIGKDAYGQTRIPAKFTEMTTDVVDLGDGIELRKLSDASQSPTDIIVYLKERKLIFTGNILFDGRMINFAEDSSMAGWLQAIDSIMAMKPAVIVQGHGDQMNPNQAIEPTYGYLTELKKQTKAAYEEGVDLIDISQYIDLSAWSHLNHFGDLNGKNIQNYYTDLEWE